MEVQVKDARMIEEGDRRDGEGEGVEKRAGNEEGEKEKKGPSILMAIRT